MKKEKDFWSHLISIGITRKRDKNACIEKKNKVQSVFSDQMVQERWMQQICCAKITDCEDSWLVAAIQTHVVLARRIGRHHGLLAIPKGIAYGALVGLNPEVNIKKKRVAAALIVYRVIPQHR